LVAMIRVSVGTVESIKNVVGKIISKALCFFKPYRFRNNVKSDKAQNNRTTCWNIEIEGCKDSNRYCN